MKRSLKKEALLIILVFAVLFAFFLISRLGRENGSYAVVTVDGAFYGRYPLSKDTDIPITKDDNVTNHAVIENGTVYMKEASCRNHICISQGESEGDDYDVITD